MPWKARHDLWAVESPRKAEKRECESRCAHSQAGGAVTLAMAGAFDVCGERALAQVAGPGGVGQVLWVVPDVAEAGRRRHLRQHGLL